MSTYQCEMTCVLWFMCASAPRHITGTGIYISIDIARLVFEAHSRHQAGRQCSPGPIWVVRLTSRKPFAAIRTVLDDHRWALAGFNKPRGCGCQTGPKLLRECEGRFEGCLGN